MIRYTEKGRWLHDAIRRAGHRLWEENGEWKSTDDTAVQAIIDGFDPLPEYKAEKVQAIKVDGLARIQQVFPAISTFDELRLVRELYLSIASASRRPTTDWQRMIDIYTAGLNAIAAVNAATTQAQVDAVSPVWPV